MRYLTYGLFGDVPTPTPTISEVVPGASFVLPGGLWLGVLVGVGLAIAVAYFFWWGWNSY